MAVTTSVTRSLPANRGFLEFAANRGFLEFHGMANRMANRGFLEFPANRGFLEFLGSLTGAGRVSFWSSLARAP